MQWIRIAVLAPHKVSLTSFFCFLDFRKNSANGYIHSAGTVTARAAIAKYMETPTSLLTADVRFFYLSFFF